MEDRELASAVAAAAQPKRAADLLMEVSKGTRTRAGWVCYARGRGQDVHAG